MVCVAFTADGKTVAAGTVLGELELWDVASGKMRSALPTQSNSVLSVAFTKDGKTLVSTTGDGFVNCWNTFEILGAKAER